MILSELAPLVSAQHGVFYSMTNPTDGTEPVLELTAGYGYDGTQAPPRRRSGSAKVSSVSAQGEDAHPAHRRARRLRAHQLRTRLVADRSTSSSSPCCSKAQCARSWSSRRSRRSASPTRRSSSSCPRASAHDEHDRANTLTENLLRQSQSRPKSSSQQEELRESNEDSNAGQPAGRPQHRGRTEERRGRTVEHLVEEKAAELAVSSKYKSEFIANMSHELRTPLNSLLILAEQLADDPEHNMTDTQVEYAGVILASGRDLLGLLNSILDLAKVESGTATSSWPTVSVGAAARRHVREFDHVARAKGSASRSTIARDSPRDDRHRSAAPAADPEEPDLERVQVHRARRRAPPRSDWPARLEPRVGVARRPRRRSSRFAVTRHRHRHRRAATTPDLRGVRPGRRHHRPSATAAPGSGCRSAASSSACSAARSRWSSTPGDGSTFTVFLPLGQVATTHRPTDDDRHAAPPDRALSLVAANNWAAKSSDRPKPDRNRPQRPRRRSVRRPQDPRHRRRLPQRVRTHRAARARPRRGDRGRERNRRDRAARAAPPTSTSC